MDDSGPAFPQPLLRSEHDSSLLAPWEYGWGGMSLRDWFAGKALIGVVADWGENTFNPDVMACRAYRLADAMLTERVRKEQA